MHQEHIRLKRGHKFLSQTALGMGAVADRGIHGRMAATFVEHQQADLGKWPLPVLIAGSGKLRCIGLCIWHILHRAIQGHQPFAEAVGPQGLRGT